MEELLRRLGRDPASLRSAAILAGSASGSLVARVRLGDEEFVLKTTTEREAVFYRAAPRLPVQVPRVIALDGTCLLLEALTPATRAAEWSTPRWHEVARQLGALHRPRVLAGFAGRSWLRRPVERRPDATARELWTADELALLDTRPAALPDCLVHGDVHAGNLLQDDAGALVWTDWQEVGVGPGPEDLALLWQRAEFDGADPPDRKSVV